MEAYNVKILVNDFRNDDGTTVESHDNTVFIYDILIDYYLTMAVL